MASAEIEYRCFVGGLAWATDNDALEKAFSPYGEIVESKVINDRETGRSRGFGFVTFATEQAMRDAIEGMNGQNLDGRNITVNEAQSRGRGGGGGGGPWLWRWVDPATQGEVVLPTAEAGGVKFALNLGFSW
ncbi:RNA-binding domain superfamily [Sesbania bispinosa]|nr:RNA-binding domain superfamily [Sesbania bispinosa]